MNCSSDLKIIANSGPSASNFKSFSQSLEHFFLTGDQNNFDNKNNFCFNMYAFVTLLTLLCSSKMQRSKLQYQIKRNSAKNYPDFLDHFD